MRFEPSIAKTPRASGFPLGLAYCVVHASALYAFLTFAMATNGLEFFYFYPREAQTILQPFALYAIVWFAMAAFSVAGLIMLGFRAKGAGERRTHWWLLAVILGASITLTLAGVFLFPDLVQFWWMGTAAVGISWLGFGSGITCVLGDRRQLLKSFLGSLLGIGAIVEIWSLSYWVNASVSPSAAWDKVGADLELNLTYAASWFFPTILVATWLSPIWIYILFRVFRRVGRGKPSVSTPADSLAVRKLKLGLDDLTLMLAIALICVFVGFYAYFRDPPWLVGTDAYWRYNDPLQRLVSSGQSGVLGAAANERHGLYLLILYGVHLLTGLSPFNIVKVSPMVLAALLSILTYFAVVNFRGNRVEGFFAGLFSATTFPTTLGVFASVHANWFALSVGLVTLLILISLGRSFENAVLKILIAPLSGILLLILHPWTWGILALSAVFAGLAFLATKNWKMFGTSWIVFLSGLASGALIFSAGSGVERARLIETLRDFTAPLAKQTLVMRPFDVLDRALRVWAPFLNPLLMIFAMIGVLALVRERHSSYKIFLLAWMVITGAGTFFAVTLKTEIWRIWYLQPLWLLGGTGVNVLLQIRNSAKHAATSNIKAAKTTAVVFVAGLAVFFLEPILGASVFYLAALSPILLNLGQRRLNSQAALMGMLTLFVCAFFLNHALRSLYPLTLDPHNFRKH